jgi:hypothetical protein
MSPHIPVDKSSDRADPLGDLAEFSPGPTAQTASREKIRDVSELMGFPSRAPRRWRTGRNTQLNLKVSADVLARFAALADQRRIPFGALLEELLDEAGG